MFERHIERNGSFSSKMRSSSADNNGNSSQKSKADPGSSGIAENTTPQTLEAAANEDKAKAGSTSQEQPSETIKWLVRFRGWRQLRLNMILR